MGILFLWHEVVKFVFSYSSALLFVVFCCMFLCSSRLFGLRFIILSLRHIGIMYAFDLLG